MVTGRSEFAKGFYIFLKRESAGKACFLAQNITSILNGTVDKKKKGEAFDFPCVN
ncbi:MAG: hypothetical protein ACJAXQ_000221 [Parvibaculaceae bacterium]|jgi:hypothetical protein|tara:strand:- start:231 stop:395 length:165 start_codon:yes stop_codon:yes gene_type:complete